MNCWVRVKSRFAGKHVQIQLFGANISKYAYSDVSLHLYRHLQTGSCMDDDADHPEQGINAMIAADKGVRTEHLISRLDYKSENTHSFER